MTNNQTSVFTRKTSVDEVAAVSMPSPMDVDHYLTDSGKATMMVPMDRIAHLSPASMPLTRIPGLNPQLTVACSGNSADYVGDVGDSGDCADCATSATPADCTTYDYCEYYYCGPTGHGYDYYDWYDTGGDPCNW